MRITYNKKYLFTVKQMCLVMLLSCFSSCSMPESSVAGNYIYMSEQNAIKAVVEQLYDKKRALVPAISIHHELSFSYFEWILEPPPYLDCKQCKEPLTDTMIITELPDIQTPYTIKISDIENRSAKMSQAEDYITFSPLMETDEQNTYCIISETFAFDYTVIFIHQLKKNKNSKFDYIKRIDSFVMF